MADKKISALTAASTPLAGTEVLPIVQSGATVKVAVSDLTAGRTQTSNGIVQGTAATGYNFSANTPAAGMTSQLLKWYEEGTFTPTIASDSGSVTLSTAVGKYTRIGRQVTINADVAVSASTAASNVYLASLPFTSASNTAGSFYGYSFTLDAGTPMMTISSGSTIATIQRSNGSGGVATLGPLIQAGTTMVFNLTYFV
jgi:hypothetical protein